MRENDICPRCGQGGLRLLTSGSPSPAAGPERGGTGFFAFMIWPGLAIICLAGFVPAIVVLAVLGVEPTRATLVINLVVIGAAVVAALLWVLERRRRGPAEQRPARACETLHFCPWCETTVTETGRYLALAARRRHG